MTQTTDGCGKASELVLKDLTVRLPGALFLDGYPPYDLKDLLLSEGKCKEDRSHVLWEGNPLMCRHAADGVFSIPAHIPYPPSLAHEMESEVLISEVVQPKTTARILTMTSAPRFLDDPRAFAQVLSKTLRLSGPRDIIYAPGLGEPRHMAVLAYLGIALFDSQPAIKAAVKGQRMVLALGGVIEDKNSSEAQLLEANYSLMRSELALISDSLKNATLRNLAEERAGADTRLMALLRLFDHEHMDLLERDLPVNRPQKMECVTRESVNRPEVQRWRARLKERYRRPPSPHILLLLPCSARKPYSLSKTHKRFADALMSVNGRNCVHEVIVTSPLGIVPRDLELFYPANKYDIPVIGVWDENEKAMIRQTLADYLANNKYDACICHFPNRDIVEPVLEDQGFKSLEYSCQDNRPTSQGSLKALRECVEKALLGTKAFPSGMKRHKEDMRSRLEFLFTDKFTEALQDFDVVGRYPEIKITSQGKQLGMYVEERGFISLTIDGARPLKDAGLCTVTIDEFSPKGTIFAQGIKDATNDIRPGDDVVVMNKSHMAIGTALMSGREMREMRSGPAVFIRHYEKKS